MLCFLSSKDSNPERVWAFRKRAGDTFLAKKRAAGPHLVGSRAFRDDTVVPASLRAGQSRASTRKSRSGLFLYYNYSFALASIADIYFVNAFQKNATPTIMDVAFFIHPKFWFTARLSVKIRQRNIPFSGPGKSAETFILYFIAALSLYLDLLYKIPYN